MEIYNEDLTRILDRSEIDYSKGYVVDEPIFVAYHEAVPAVEEISHIEEIPLPNGNIYERKVVDVPAVKGRDAWDEYKMVFVYKLYTEKELAEQEITKLKKQLSDTDYQAIKYAEGELTDAEYAPMKEQRREWRDRINELQKNE